MRRHLIMHLPTTTISLACEGVLHVCLASVRCWNIFFMSVNLLMSSRVFWMFLVAPSVSNAPVSTFSPPSTLFYRMRRYCFNHRLSCTNVNITRCYFILPLHNGAAINLEEYNFETSNYPAPMWQQTISQYSFSHVRFRRRWQKWPSTWRTFPNWRTLMNSNKPTSASKTQTGTPPRPAPFFFSNGFFQPSISFVRSLTTERQLVPCRSPRFACKRLEVRHLLSRLR